MATRYEAALADACSLIVDCPHNTAPESDPAYAFAVGTKAIANGRIDFAQARSVSAETYATWTMRAVPEPGDLILCREAPVGPAALVPATPRVCLGQRTVLLRPNRQRVVPEYLLYTLLSPGIQASLRKLSEGSTVAHLNVAEIKRFAVLLPALEEQRRIVAVLGALDDKIDSNRRLAALLEETAAALFRARFAEFVGVEEFEQSEIGRLPRGWSVARVGDLAVLNEQSHTTRSHPDQIRYIDISSVSPREIRDVRDLAFNDAPSRARRIVRTGDTIVSTVRPERRAMAFVHEAEPGLTASTGFAVVTPKAGAATYLYRCVTSDPCIDYLTAAATGSAYPAVNASALASWKVPVPPDRGEQYEQVARPLEALRHRLDSECALLASIRDALLPKLVCGDMRVPDSTDPAEAIEPTVA